MITNNKLLFTDKTTFESTQEITFIAYDDIVYLESFENKTKVHMIRGNSQIIYESLNEITHKLKAYPLFFKSHQSYIVNLNHLQEFSTKHKNNLTLTGTINIPLSKEKFNEFMKVINAIFYT